MAPKVSVVLPFYNAERTVGAAIESVLQDAGPDVEVLLLDDGSEDNSLNIARSFSRDPRVNVLSHDNEGLAAALNRGIAAAGGEYIARMDADDVVVSGRLAEQCRLLGSDPQVSLVGGQIERIVDGRVISASRLPLGHKEIVRGLLRGEHVLCHPAVMFRREHALRAGLYWQYGVGEDWDFYLRMSREGLVANLSEVVLRYTYHEGSINSTSTTALRTNIRYAVSCHERSIRRESTLTRDEFVAGLSRLNRLSISGEVVGLRLYRRSIRLSGPDMPFSRRTAGLALLGLSGLMAPALAMSRLRSLGRSMCARLKRT